MLAGKVAIVTGASYGMGGTIAELFAGASVALTARGREKLDEVVAGIGAKGYSIKCFFKCLNWLYKLIVEGKYNEICTFS